MGAYGSFVTEFPELMETIPVWTKEDKSDERAIRAIFMPTEGGNIVRKKYPSASWALDITDSDVLIVPNSYLDKIHIGDFVYYKSVRRVKGSPGDFTVSADFVLFSIETLVGATPQQTEELQLKQGTFL